MKKKIQKMILLLIICISSFMLSGCEDVDWDLASLAVEAWAEENGLYRDGKFAPVPMLEKAVGDTVRDVTHDEPFVQLDGLDVIRDIEKADELADQALTTFDTAKMASALAIRPHDWSLHEKDGVVWLTNGNSAAAQAAFDKADQLLLDNVGSGGGCTTMRINQLRTRANALQRAGTYCIDNANCPGKDIRVQLEATMQQIEQIYQVGTAPICEGK
jgi:hypothetical protein